MNETGNRPAVPTVPRATGQRQAPPETGQTRWHAEWAWLPAGPRPDVLIEARAGRFTAVRAGVPAASTDATRLPGLTLPGFANAHSHAFHRGLRGRTQDGRGTFWSWRERMYELAQRLTPDNYLTLARAVYAEMALAGITCVGEFHYLHHDRDGRPYADPNAMGVALVEAAAQAGVRITVLDAAYLTAGVDGEPLAGVQRRFGDGDAARWAERVDAFRPAGAHSRRGAAVHSVRAVPAEQIPEVAGWAAVRRAPLHVHLCEQRAENEACQARYGRSPTALLAGAGALGRRTTAVHATHLDGGDRIELGRTGTGVCLCPTTERDLADGIGPARALASVGCPMSLGTDSHAVVDMFEEARAMELDERLAGGRRGNFTAAELLHAAGTAGHAALGWPDAGALVPGARADLVAVRLDSARTAAVPPAGVPFAATAADVHTVVADGRTIVREGRHVSVDVAAELREAIGALST